MNYNLSSSHEGESSDQLSDDYIQWQEAMKNVEFHAGQTSIQADRGNVSVQTDLEAQEEAHGKVKRLFQRIHGVKDFIKKKIGLSGGDELTEMTDDALVYIAKETIASADEDGIRTDAESVEVEEAVSSVVVQGAMEEAGMEQSTSDNPILELNQESTQPDLVASIESLRAEGASLADGESVAELATHVIERDSSMNQESTSLESGGHKTRKTVAEVVGIFGEQEGEFVPRTEIICDRDHIEGQRIDVINMCKSGVVELKFKLRAPTEAMITMISELKGRDEQAEITTPSGAVLRRGKIEYYKNGAEPFYDLCDAFVFEKDGVRVFVADTDKVPPKRTAIGLVEVKVPISKKPEEAELILKEILEEDLGISDALGEVSEMSEKEYKEARYRWQHVITGELTSEQTEQAERLEREEVFPGYSTFIERGIHKEYLRKYGKDIRVCHGSRGDSSTIISILESGLMCTTERYSRGMSVDGASSDIDIRSGGGDNVFTRISNGAERVKSRVRGKGSFRIVFKPEIFDRTDWFAYGNDQCGSTEEGVFSGRLSPNQIFSMASKSSTLFLGSNELMFRTGIGVDYIESIEVGDSEERDKTITELRSMGIEEIGGRSIEDVIVLSTEDLEVRRQEKEIQAIISGEEPYESIEQLVDLTCMDDNTVLALKPVIEAIIAHGQKEKLASDMADFIKELDLDLLKRLASGELSEAYLYLQDTLGLDYSASYKERIAGKRQAIISGKESYESIDQLLYLADSETDITTVLGPVVDTIIAHGQKEKLASDITDYFEKWMGVNELRILAFGETVEGFSNDDKELFQYLMSALGMDYGGLYTELLAKQYSGNKAMHAIISGEEPYESIEQLFELADFSSDSWSFRLKNMFDAIIIRGGKEKLMKDMTDYIINNYGLNKLKELASGDLDEVFSFVQVTLGLDYSTIYQEALETGK